MFLQMFSIPIAAGPCIPRINRNRSITASPEVAMETVIAPRLVHCSGREALISLPVHGILWRRNTTISHRWWEHGAYRGTTIYLLWNNELPK